jgi:hypothetical protein
MGSQAEGNFAHNLSHRLVQPATISAISLKNPNINANYRLVVDFMAIK